MNRQIDVHLAEPVSLRVAAALKDTSTRSPFHDPPGFGGANATLAVGAALLTALGIGAGVALRMVRNDLESSLFFLAIMVVGSGLALLAKHWAWWVAGYLAFFGGTFGLVSLAVETSKAVERPRLAIAAETLATGMTKITAVVKAEGLLSKQMIYILARGRRRDLTHPVAGEVQGKGTQPGAAVIKEAVLGPNADGIVDTSFTLDLSASVYSDIVVTAIRTDSDSISSVDSSDAQEDWQDCIPKEKSSSNYGCARFILPRSPLRPSLDLSYAASSAESAGTITANVRAGSIPPSHAVLLSIWTGDRLATRQILAPDIVGNVKATAQVSITRRDRDACALAVAITDTSILPDQRKSCDASPLEARAAVASLTL